MFTSTLKWIALDCFVCSWDNNVEVKSINSYFCFVWFIKVKFILDYNSKLEGLLYVTYWNIGLRVEVWGPSLKFEVWKIYIYKSRVEKELGNEIVKYLGQVLRGLGLYCNWGNVGVGQKVECRCKWKWQWLVKGHISPNSQIPIQKKQILISFT